MKSVARRFRHKHVIVVTSRFVSRTRSTPRMLWAHREIDLKTAWHTFSEFIKTVPMRSGRNRSKHSGGVLIVFDAAGKHIGSSHWRFVSESRRSTYLFRVSFLVQIQRSTCLLTIVISNEPGVHKYKPHQKTMFMSDDRFRKLRGAQSTSNSIRPIVGLLQRRCEQKW
jgi:hypothetical protein